MLRSDAARPVVQLAWPPVPCCALVCPGVLCWCALVLSAGAARRESGAGGRGALVEARLGGAGEVDHHQVVVSVVPL